MVRGKEIPPISEESNICLNCDTVYTGSYCNRCGQSRNTPRYRFSNAFRNILGGFTNIDNGFGRTLLDLLYRPGYMIRDFIAGKRILYFRPFQTLFVLAALYIMAVQLVDPEALKEKKGKSPEAQRQEIVAAREQLQKRIETATDPTTQNILNKTIEGLDKKLENLETEDSTDIRKNNLIAARELLQKQMKETKKPDQKEVLAQTIKELNQDLEKLETSKNLKKDNITLQINGDEDDELIDELLEG